MKTRTMTDIEIINRLNDISYFLQSRKDINYTKKDHEALCRAKEAIEHDMKNNLLDEVTKALNDYHVVHPNPLEVVTLQRYLKGIATVKVVGQDIVISWLKENKEDDT